MSCDMRIWRNFVGRMDLPSPCVAGIDVHHKAPQGRMEELQRNAWIPASADNRHFRKTSEERIVEKEAGQSMIEWFYAGLWHVSTSTFS